MGVALRWLFRDVPIHRLGLLHNHVLDCEAMFPIIKTRIPCYTRQILCVLLWGNSICMYVVFSMLSRLYKARLGINSQFVGPSNSIVFFDGGTRLEQWSWQTTSFFYISRIVWDGIAPCNLGLQYIPSNATTTWYILNHSMRFYIQGLSAESVWYIPLFLSVQHAAYCAIYEWWILVYIAARFDAAHCLRPRLLGGIS